MLLACKYQMDWVRVAFNKLYLTAHIQLPPRFPKLFAILIVFSSLKGKGRNSGVRKYKSSRSNSPQVRGTGVRALLQQLLGTQDQGDPVGNTKELVFLLAWEKLSAENSYASPWFWFFIASGLLFVPDYFFWKITLLLFFVKSKTAVWVAQEFD